MCASPDPWAAWIGLLNLHRYDGDSQAFQAYLSLLQGLHDRAESLGWAWVAVLEKYLVEGDLSDVDSIREMFVTEFRNRFRWKGSGEKSA